jgi:hypothetical protein
MKDDEVYMAFKFTIRDGIDIAFMVIGLAWFIIEGDGAGSTGPFGLGLVGLGLGSMLRGSAITDEQEDEVS